MKLFGIEENATVCANCNHYVQHYIYDSYRRGYIACCMGHCCYPRTKRRTPDTEACIYFEFDKQRRNEYETGRF